jgi:hypothetical protein
LVPKFDYYLDESDPDIVVLRCQDGSFAAAFSAQGATRDGIVEAAKEDYRRLLEANAECLGSSGRRRPTEERSGRLEAKPSVIRSGHPPSVPTGSSP